MLSIAICDDDEIIRDKICKLLNALSNQYKLTQFQSGIDLLLIADTFDLVILDIEMPGMDGMEVAEGLIKFDNNPYVIFLTSHAEHALLGYTVNAFRFLTKPINTSAFNEAIIAAENQIDSTNILILGKKGEKIFLRYADIIYLQSLGDNTAIFTTEKTYISNKPLCYFLEELSTAYFFQTHRQYIVALGRIIGTKISNVMLRDSDKKIPLSRDRKKHLEEAMLRHYKEIGRIL